MKPYFEVTSKWVDQSHRAITSVDFGNLKHCGALYNAKVTPDVIWSDDICGKGNVREDAIQHMRCPGYKLELFVSFARTYTNEYKIAEKALQSIGETLVSKTKADTELPHGRITEVLS